MNIGVAETNTSIALPRKNIGGEAIYYPESDGKPIGETDLHIRLILQLLSLLDTHFHHTPKVKVIADMMFYYEEGNPRKVISPDVMVIKGVGKHLRRVYKLWKEKSPDVVFEISSRETWRDDLQKKYKLYENLGVKEYYVFDPEYKYLAEPLLAHHLKNGVFKPIKVKKGRIFSPSLNLELVDTGETLRLFNPETQSFLLTNEELAENNLELAQNYFELEQNNFELAQNNLELGQKLSQADEEIEQLKAELAKLKKQK
jgi:Uma2 family endonuclease